MIKLIATDLDGTLLNNNKEISDNTLNTLKQCIEKGIKVCFISGRSLSNMKHTVNNRIKDIVYVSDNGAQITFSTHQQIKNIKISDIKAIHNIAVKNNIHFSINGLVNTYILDSDNLYYDVLLTYGIKPVKFTTFDEITEQVVKITIYDINGSTKLVSLFENLPNVSVTISGDVWLDISPLNCHKGSAIKSVLDHYNIDPRNCIVFGDHLNDCSLFEVIPNSFAVKNAHPQLKKIAFKVLEYTNDEEAVAKKIQEYL